ncbi:MAG: MarR family transcriptional regulator [Thermoplasmata archaeon]|nr:MarR family transcriptional regulator [Thermoplasmata archaeon]
MSALTESSNRNSLILAGLLAGAIILIVGITLTLWDAGGMTEDMWSHHGMGLSFPMGMSFVVLGGVVLVILFVLAIPQPRGVERPVAAYIPMTPLQNNEDWTPEMRNLALRLLQGDERRMLRQIFDAGGQILQKDLVYRAGFSKAKVTRLLDKLERRGLIIRERHGSTNLVRVLEDLGGKNDGISEK